MLSHTIIKLKLQMVTLQPFISTSKLYTCMWGHIVWAERIPERKRWVDNSSFSITHQEIVAVV